MFIIADIFSQQVANNFNFEVQIDPCLYEFIWYWPYKTKRHKLKWISILNIKYIMGLTVLLQLEVEGSNKIYGIKHQIYFILIVVRDSYIISTTNVEHIDQTIHQYLNINQHLLLLTPNLATDQHSNLSPTQWQHYHYTKQLKFSHPAIWQMRKKTCPSPYLELAQHTIPRIPSPFICLVLILSFLAFHKTQMVVCYKDTIMQISNHNIVCLSIIHRYR